jgi:hypothetical protein
MGTEDLYVQARNQVEYDLRARTAMNRYFSSWLDHHQTQKEKWARLVRYRYLLSRMRLNKLFWAWKLQIRQRKVNKLKASIVEHQRYKGVIREVFSAWRLEVDITIEALNKLYTGGSKHLLRTAFAFIRYRNRDQVAKRE